MLILLAFADIQLRPVELHGQHANLKAS